MPWVWSSETVQRVNEYFLCAWVCVCVFVCVQIYIWIYVLSTHFFFVCSLDILFRSHFCLEDNSSIWRPTHHSSLVQWRHCTRLEQGMYVHICSLSGNFCLCYNSIVVADRQFVSVVYNNIVKRDRNTRTDSLMAFCHLPSSSWKEKEREIVHILPPDYPNSFRLKEENYN